jgi:DNA-directed RNA polymerase subunit M/transcription elongation factor TFIIS
MHTGPVPGEYTDGWRDCEITNPNFKCRKCGGKSIKYREWESSCGGYDDTKYACKDCGYSWWVESSDS